jgi:hypothetical protein
MDMVSGFGRIFLKGFAGSGSSACLSLFYGRAFRIWTDIFSKFFWGEIRLIKEAKKIKSFSVQNAGARPWEGRRAEQPH